MLLKEGGWLDTVCSLVEKPAGRRDEVPQLQAKQTFCFFTRINTLFSYNLWGTSVQLLAYNHKNEIMSVFQAWADKRGFFFSFFLEGASNMRLTLPHSLQPPPLFFQITSEIPLKYSGASSSRHIFTFIVHDIKRSNYLISELWKHVCYEKTSKLSFNWCHFSRCWQGAYLFGTFFPS